MLAVKKLDPRATLPTVANPGEDLAYDLYALEDTVLCVVPTKVRTGIAAQAYQKVASNHPTGEFSPLGLLIRDRSSMAAKGIVSSGGVLDAGYTGEILVILTAVALSCTIKAGDKIAQMIPVPILTGEVIEVDTLRESSRGDKGFGSSGV